MPIRIATTENEARFHHYGPVVDSPDFEWLGTIHTPFDENSLAGVDALVCSCEYHWPTRLAILACKRLGVPTFHVLDGIVEWRNLFENPRSSDPAQGAPLFRPLIADHTFALGEAQKWVLRWLGNTSVHATGLPRLDGIAAKPCRAGAAAGHPRLLIATANTPWFDASQELRFKQEFGEIVAAIDRAGHQLECRWRVAGSVAAHFNLPQQDGRSVIEALSETDALITTPSTLAIEAMLHGIPTLVFDPYGRSCMNPSTWFANSAVSVLEQLPSLLAPDPERAAFQDAIRGLNTATDQSATLRIREIIRRVVNREALPAATLSAELSVMPPPKERADWPANLSTSELQGLAMTIPSLERKLHDARTDVQRLLDERTNPTLRHAFGCLYRAILPASR